MKRVLAAVLVVVAWAACEAALARRPDLDDHGRYAASLSSTAARNYLRFGLAPSRGAPLANGGSLELARESPYLSQPVLDDLALAGWFDAFGVSVRAARARTVFVGVLALLALGLASGSPWLPLAFGSIPIVVYYAHAAFPPFVGASALAIAAAARLRRLEGAGRAALLLQAFSLLVAMGATWKGVLFALVWLVSDVRARRRDGLLLAALAVAFLALELGYVVWVGALPEVVAKIQARTGVASVLRVLRYGRGLGYGHALLVLAWFASRRRAPRDEVALELFLAPIPWFLVFQRRVSEHDHEMLYFAPAVAFACWSVLDGLAARRRGALRAALAALMLVGTGAAIGLDLEHRDDFTLPRELGAAIREAIPDDLAAATSSHEHSVIWEADRFVHLDVHSESDLDGLLARRDRLSPVCMVVPRRDADTELARALARRYPAEERGSVLVFWCGNKPAMPGRSR